MSRRRQPPGPGTTTWAIAIAVATGLITAALIWFAGTDCSETVTKCRHSEVDVN